MNMKLNSDELARDADLFATLATEDAESGRRLHEVLVSRATAEGLLDVAYRTLDTPVGSLLLATTEEGLLKVAYPVEGQDAVLERLAGEVSPRILHAPQRLDAAARELDDYFEGRRNSFDLALDMRLAHGFRREVLSHLRQIAYGKTASYASLAAASGRPKAVRAAASACATNPLPIVIPCHRIVRSDGSLGGYAGGLNAKRILLKLEAAG